MLTGLLNKWTTAAGDPADSASSASAFLASPPASAKTPPPPTARPPPRPPPSSSHQADSSLRRVYLGTADQGLLNISKVKSVIHGGDKRSLLGTGPIFEETFHASCRWKSACVCE